MNNLHSIQYILIFPKRKHRWKYYLNGNLDDSYHLKTEDLKDFIFSVCNSSISEKINEHIQSYTPFLIDVNNNKVHTVSLDLEKAKEYYAKDFWKKQTDIKKAFNEYSKNQKNELKNLYDVPHSNTNDKLLDKFTKIDY